MLKDWGINGLIFVGLTHKVNEVENDKIDWKNGEVFTSGVKLMHKVALIYILDDRICTIGVVNSILLIVQNSHVYGTIGF